MFRVGMILGPAIFFGGVVDWILVSTHLAELIEKTLPWMGFINHPAGIPVLIIVGILVFIAAWTERRKDREMDDLRQHEPNTYNSAPTPSIAPIQSASPSISQTASPAIDASQKLELHQHFAGAVNSAYQNSASKGRAKPGVAYVGRRVKELIHVNPLSPYFDEVMEDTPKAIRVKAMVVNYRNKLIPDQIVADWDYVRAHIIYRDRNGQEIESIGTASWVGTDKKYTHFVGAVARSVIIAVQQGDGTWIGVSPEEETVLGRDFDYRNLTTIDLPKEVYSVDVVLHDAKGFSLEPNRFLLDLNHGVFGEG